MTEGSIPDKYGCCEDVHKLTPASTENPTLDNCGCCEGIQKITAELAERLVENPPGLSVLRYRVGTYHRFRSSMIASLRTALPLLTTRADNDFAIALFDAWATVADILTFYQERIANEGFLRTATERMSVLELARSVGYELRAGVAASDLSCIQSGRLTRRCQQVNHRCWYEGTKSAHSRKESP